MTRFPTNSTSIVLIRIKLNAILYKIIDLKERIKILQNKYWLHRISHHEEISYYLLNKGYLTIGWSIFFEYPEDIIDIIKENDTDLYFRKYTESIGIRNTGKWSLYNFGKMKMGDIVLVPMYEGKFGVYKIVEEMQPIRCLDTKNFSVNENEKYEILNSYLVKSSNKKIVDLGFFIKVESVLKYQDPKPRNYAASKLISRMKIRQTNADISDLSDEVNSAINENGPYDVYSIFIDDIKNKFINYKIFLEYTPDQIELIVKQYFLSKGADKVKIPPKNEPEKPAGADADVIAEFFDLKTTYYVQVKHHEDETGIYGLEQIRDYIYYVNNNPVDEDEVNVAWLLTTATFAEDVKEKAKEYKVNGLVNIRLIDGREFIEMIFNAGIDLLDLKNSVKD